MDAGRSILLQNLFQSYKPALDSLKLPLHQRKAVESITACRSGALGTSYYRCPNNHAVHEQHHSCRHRSCYRCSRAAQQRWVDAQKKRLLNCPHFHVVFTLPSEYRALWQYNRAWFIGAMFACVQSSLLQLTRNPRYGGYTPGLLLNLHTWGRRLNFHPHIHGLVTAGGLTAQGEWRDAKKILVPIRALKLLYRGKLQAMLKQALYQQAIKLPPDMRIGDCLNLHRMAYQKQWSIRIEEQYRHGRGVLLYLARYLKGGPLNPAQITRCDAKGIGFFYKDHRDGRTKLLTLSPLSIIRRLLSHVPPKGVHTVRYYGLYATACRNKRNRCRALHGDLSSLESASGGTAKDAVNWFCQRCGEALRLIARQGWRRQKGNSIKRDKARATTPLVQQEDQHAPANALRTRDPCYSAA